MYQINIIVEILEDGDMVWDSFVIILEGRDSLDKSWHKGCMDLLQETKGGIQRVIQARCNKEREC